MYRIAFETKFTFGDRVRFDSKAQNRCGTGKIFAITIDEQGNVDYIIEINDESTHDLQPGILEEEIELLK